jgi:DNA-binding MurR/RpiR family transcriptional regulator
VSGRTASLLQLVADRYPALSASHQKVARFMLGQTSSAAFMTIEELARAAGTSKSSVERFAQSLGFPGFPALKGQLADLVREALAPSEKLRAAVKQSGSPAETLRAVLTEDLANLQESLRAVSPAAFTRAVQALIRAERVFILGLGASAALAMLAAHRLSIFHGDVQLITGGGGQIYRKLIWLTRRDALLVISLPRYAREAVEATRFTRERRATILAVTDQPASPLTALADAALLARADRSTLVSSPVAALSVLDALVAAVATQRKQSLPRFTQLTQRLYGYYDPRGLRSLASFSGRAGRREGGKK